jgi:hypothetical protein
MRGVAMPVARRVLRLAPVVGAVALSAAACASGSAAESRENLTRVRITIGKSVLTAHLRDNPTARSLIPTAAQALLP